MNPSATSTNDLERARERLLRALPKGSACAEIGVWQGDFSAQILEIVEPVRLWLVDPWRHESDARYERAWYGGSCAGGQAQMDRVFAEVELRFARERADGRVVLLRSDSVTAADRLEDASLDWVYIDGNHTFEFVSRDLEAWWPKVKPGGWITGDDYRLDGWWQDGVVRAVDGFAASGRARLVSVDGAQYVLQR